MSIVTKTGDSGTTGLFGGGRVSKNSPRLHAYGTVDELNACIGVVLSSNDLSAARRHELTHVQNLLFRVGADLATPLAVNAKVDRMAKEHVFQLEEWIHTWEAALPPQTSFILPGGSVASANLHLARTICRRAERWIVALEREETINPAVRIFINRLSDYLFIAARAANHEKGIPDVSVDYSV